MLSHRGPILPLIRMRRVIPCWRPYNAGREILLLAAKNEMFAWLNPASTHLVFDRAGFHLKLTHKRCQLEIGFRDGFEERRPNRTVSIDTFLKRELKGPLQSRILSCRSTGFGVNERLRDRTPWRKLQASRSEPIETRETIRGGGRARPVELDGSACFCARGLDIRHF